MAENYVDEALRDHHRFACLREYQNSIKESSKQLLEDKIKKLGVSDRFRVLETEIRGPNDSLFVFRGLDGFSADSIKSLEGFDRAWVDEAQRISVRSLNLMTPTFRATGTEMTFTWNPIAPDDPVEVLFEQRKDSTNTVCVAANYFDNPWFPPDLREDMEWDRVRDPDKYAHVWLGGYQKHSQTRVFHNWCIADFDIPAGARFYQGADWGFSVDPTVLIRLFIAGRTIYVCNEAYQVGCEIDKTPALFDTIPGSRRWRIRADSARPETISYMNGQGFDIVPATKGPNSVEDGIEFLKGYDIVVHPSCRHTSDEFSKYAWKFDKRTEEVLPILEDKNNHVIDAARYALEEVRLGSGLPYITPAVVSRAAMPRNVQPFLPTLGRPTPVERPHLAASGLDISMELLQRSRQLGRRR